LRPALIVGRCNPALKLFHDRLAPWRASTSRNSSRI
jgi:hypothetical protein